MHVKINFTSRDSREGVIEIDGHKVKARSINFRAEAIGLPTLEIEMMPDSIEIDSPHTSVTFEPQVYGHKRDEYGDGYQCAPEVCGGTRMDPCAYPPEITAQLDAEAAEEFAKLDKRRGDVTL